MDGIQETKVCKQKSSLSGEERWASAALSKSATVTTQRFYQVRERKPLAYQFISLHTE